MLLALDIGNTFIKYGIYHDAELLDFGRIDHEKFDAKKFEEMNINECAMSSVVPKTARFVSQILKEELNITPFNITRQLKLGLNIKYNSIETLGIDRICAAVGAYYILEKHNNIIFADLGTATTINLVTEGQFRGGLILPGLKTMINSLTSNTAQLPQVDLLKYSDFIGTDTESCIISGVLNTTISIIEKSIYKTTATEAPKLILTGGNARYIIPFLNVEHQFVKDLVLQGVKNIFALNKNN